MELHPQFTDPRYKMAPGAWDLLAARYNFRVYQRVLQKVPGPVPSLNTAQNLKDTRKKLAFQAQEAIAAVHSHRAFEVQEQATAPQTRKVSTSRRGKHGCRPHRMSMPGGSDAAMMSPSGNQLKSCHLCTRAFRGVPVLRRKHHCCECFGMLIFQGSFCMQRLNLTNTAPGTGGATADARSALRVAVERDINVIRVFREHIRSLWQQEVSSYFRQNHITCSNMSGYLVAFHLRTIHSAQLVFHSQQSHIL